MMAKSESRTIRRRFLFFQGDALFAQLKIESIDPVKVHPKADESENIH